MDTLHARKPKQRRSRESYERMIEGAVAILREKGLEGLTLAEVSRRSHVSIGSIYCRVQSKEHLLREVQARVLGEMDHEFAMLVNRVRRRMLPLRELVPVVVRELAQFLRRHAVLLNSFMQQAQRDEHMASEGRHSYSQAMIDFKLLLLEHQAEFGHPDPERATSACFIIVYGTLARYLGLGAIPGGHSGAGEGDWKQLVDDLGLMALAFLTTHHATKSSH